MTADDEGVLRVQFDQGETLTVWNPTGVTATSAAFRIEQAARVRWEWFYYDRPQTPENLQRIEYVRSPDGRITVTDTFAEGSVRNHVHSPDEAAVEMLSTFAE